MEVPYPIVLMSDSVPGLSNKVVCALVWPKLAAYESPFTFFRLRLISQAWRHLVDSSLDWQVVVFLKLDKEGYLYYCRHVVNEMPLSIVPHYRMELRRYCIMLDEDISNFETGSSLTPNKVSSGEKKIPGKIGGRKKENMFHSWSR